MNGLSGERPPVVDRSPVDSELESPLLTSASGSGGAGAG